MWINITERGCAEFEGLLVGGGDGEVVFLAGGCGPLVGLEVEVDNPGFGLVEGEFSYDFAIGVGFVEFYLQWDGFGGDPECDASDEWAVCNEGLAEFSLGGGPCLEIGLDSGLRSEVDSGVFAGLDSDGCGGATGVGQVDSGGEWFGGEFSGGAGVGEPDFAGGLVEDADDAFVSA